MSKVSDLYEQDLQEQLDSIPYLKLLYRDGEAVGSIIKHESVAGTMFVVTGYTLEPCFEGSSNNYSREYSYETEWTDNPSEVLAAYSEALDKALEDMGASDEEPKPVSVNYTEVEDRPIVGSFIVLFFHAGGLWGKYLKWYGNGLFEINEYGERLGGSCYADTALNQARYFVEHSGGKS